MLLVAMIVTHAIGWPHWHPWAEAREAAPQCAGRAQDYEPQIHRVGHKPPSWVSEELVGSVQKWQAPGGTALVAGVCAAREALREPACSGLCSLLHRAPHLHHERERTALGRSRQWEATVCYHLYFQKINSDHSHQSLDSTVLFGQKALRSPVIPWLHDECHS